MSKLYDITSQKEDKLGKTISKMLKGTTMAKAMKEDEEEDCKYQIFCSSVIDLCYAAKDMYCEDDKPFDTVIDALVEGLKKFKGKEEELKKACEEQEDEDD